jgi:hypothetical protein
VYLRFLLFRHIFIWELYNIAWQCYRRIPYKRCQRIRQYSFILVTTKNKYSPCLKNS